jgi:formate transporter
MQVARARHRATCLFNQDVSGGLNFHSGLLGLILVVVGGAELFTGNNLIVMVWASGKVSTLKLLRNWVIVSQSGR